MAATAGRNWKLRSAAADQNVRITSVPIVRAPVSLNEATPVAVWKDLMKTLLPPRDWS
jgi:hypothetical protein